MATTITLSVFDPASLTDQSRARLEALLTQLDQATADRNEYLNAGRLAALREYLTDPSGHAFESDYENIYQAIAPERWPLLLDALAAGFKAGDEDAAAAMTQLRALPVDLQIEAVAFAGLKYTNHVDLSAERGHWAKIDGLYEVILAEYPDILNGKEDLLGAIAMGDALKKRETSLTKAWKTANSQQKLALAQEMLAEAYPDDDVSHLHMVPVQLKKVAAAYVSLGADTVLCGKMFTESKTSDFPMYLVNHEFQHRRQYQLIAKLKEGKLEHGSADYYRARLFRANTEGGYLTASTATNGFMRVARMTDYFEQPNEQNANDCAMIASKCGGTSGAAVWSFSEGLSKALSAAARPFDTAIHSTQVAASGVASLARRIPGFR